MGLFDIWKPADEVTAADINPWYNLIGFLGQGGQSILKGTDQEWKGNLGGIAATMAKNAQAGDANRDANNTLRQLMGLIRDPDVSGVKAKTNPQTGETSINVSGLARTPGMPDWTQQRITAPASILPTPAPSAPAPPASSFAASTPSVSQQTASSSLGSMLASAPNFFQAQRPWKWWE
jgi:hypothetical protein